MSRQWSVTGSHESSHGMRLFQITNHRQGLIVYCSDSVYYLRRKGTRLNCTWKIFKNQLPPGDLCKCIMNGNGEVYCAEELGNLYHMEMLSDNVTFNTIHGENERNLDFIILKGIKEECIVMLTEKCTLKAVEMSRFLVYSIYHIPHASALYAHNVSPCIMVGTTTGMLHFINYTDVREPVEVCNIETIHNYPIMSLQFLDLLGIYRTAYNHFHLVKTDIAREHCYEIALIEHLDENIGICDYFMGDFNCIYMFINKNTDIILPHTNELWYFQWVPEKNKMKRLNYELPVIYRDVACPLDHNKTVTEFFAISLESNIIDCLHLRTDVEEFQLMQRIQTVHLSNITGIMNIRNLMTWGVDGIFLHFRSHRKSPKLYGICQVLQMKYRPKVVKKVNASYIGK